MPAQIGIIETGRPSADLLKTHKDYVEMVCDWLGYDLDQAVRFAACDHELPTDPHLAQFWVITGSKAGVYEQLSWIAPLEAFIRACQKAQVPMVGICFGHQLIAQALGGTVQNSPKGWGLGVHQYLPKTRVTGFERLERPFSLQAVHQDQITALPKGAIHLAQSSFCEYAAVCYPDFALTFQGHPEFDAQYTRDLLVARRDIAMPADRVDQALDHIDDPIDAAELGVITRHWLERMITTDTTDRA